MPPPRCKLTFDLLTLKVVSESRDVGYLCANLSSWYRPLCSRLRPDVRDRQTSSDDRHASSLNVQSYRSGGIIKADCLAPTQTRDVVLEASASARGGLEAVF